MIVTRRDRLPCSGSLISRAGLNHLSRRYDPRKVVKAHRPDDQHHHTKSPRIDPVTATFGETINIAPSLLIAVQCAFNAIW